MAHVRKKLPAFPGEGQLRCRGFQGPVEYEILGDPASLRLGPLRLRGQLTVSPDVAEQAFREGEGTLTLEDGKAFRISMLGHSAGSGVVYFEIRI